MIVAYAGRLPLSGNLYQTDERDTPYLIGVVPRTSVRPLRILVNLFNHIIQRGRNE